MAATRKQWYFINESNGYFMMENSPIMYDLNVCHTIGDIFRMERSNLGPMNGCKQCFQKGFVRGVFVASCNNCAMNLFAQDDHLYRAWHSMKKNMNILDVGYKQYKNRTLRIYKEQEGNNNNNNNKCKISVHTRFKDSPNYVN